MLKQLRGRDATRLDETAAESGVEGSFFPYRSGLAQPGVFMVSQELILMTSQLPRCRVIFIFALPGNLALKTNELCSHWVAVFLQVVGVDQARNIIVRGITDRLNERIVNGHDCFPS